MATLNGIGTKFNGFQKSGTEGVSHVTLWITFLYFPVLPLKSYAIKRHATDMREFKYDVLERKSLQLKSVLTTYFYGWIVTPVLWFWPMPFAVREVGEYLGYTNEKAEGAFYYFIITFAIIWIIVFAWKWKDWDEKRGLPAVS